MAATVVAKRLTTSACLLLVSGVKLVVAAFTASGLRKRLTAGRTAGINHLRREPFLRQSGHAVAALLRVVTRSFVAFVLELHPKKFKV